MGDSSIPMTYHSGKYWHQTLDDRTTTASSTSAFTSTSSAAVVLLCQTIGKPGDRLKEARSSALTYKWCDSCEISQRVKSWTQKNCAFVTSPPVSKVCTLLSSVSSAASRIVSSRRSNNRSGLYSSRSVDTTATKHDPGKTGRRKFKDVYSIVQMLLFLWVLIVLPGATQAQIGGRGEDRRICQEITIPMCRGIGYNYTHMPNQFHHENQEEAGLEVHQFWPLVEIQCSPDLKFFLCSLYAPICMETYHKPLPACRSVCQRAKAGCAPLMRQYGFKWPEKMNCDELPVQGDRDQLCMDFNRTQSSTRYSSKRPNDVYTHLIPVQTTTVKDCECKCRLATIDNSTGEEYQGISIGGQQNCGMTCKSPYFTEDERTFTQFWIGLWSILCCISTTLTVLTYIIDMERFKYPERPIIFLSACYTMVSIGFIIRLIVGHEAIACHTKGEGHGEGHSDIIRYSTNGPAICTIVFILTYFFSMASSIWWIILAFTWFLSAGLKWGQEAIANYSQYFHVAAWLLPSVKTILILALKYVDGDPVSGICYVGNQSVLNLRLFVLAPLSVYLLIGATFLLAGFVSLFRIRKAIKMQGPGKTDKLEKLMIRIGVFTVLYTVPATIVIACNFYDQHFRDLWETNKNCPCNVGHTADYSVFMLKYFMCLVVGITSGFWIWSGKTIESYKKFYHKVFKCGGQRNQRPPQNNRTLAQKYPSPPPSINPSYQSVKPMPLSHV